MMTGSWQRQARLLRRMKAEEGMVGFSGSLRFQPLICDDSPHFNLAHVARKQCKGETKVQQESRHPTKPILRLQTARVSVHSCPVETGFL